MIKSLVNPILIFTGHQMEQNQTMHVARAVSDLSKAFSTDPCQTLDLLQPHSADKDRKYQTELMISPQDDCPREGIGVKCGGC